MGFSGVNLVKTKLTPDKVQPEKACRTSINRPKSVILSRARERKICREREKFIPVYPKPVMDEKLRGLQLVVSFIKS